MTHVSLYLKSLGVFVTFILCMINSYAQINALNHDDKFISIGYGYPFIATSFVGFAYSNQYDIKSSIGPIYAKAEYVLSPSLSVGINFAYAYAIVDQNPVTYTNIYGSTQGTYLSNRTKYSTYSVLLRFNYHIALNKKVDPYLGLGVGYRYAYNKYFQNIVDSLGHSTWQQTTYGSEVGINFPFGFEFTGGVRYYFTPTCAAYFEAGLAKSPIQLGFTYRFIKPVSKPDTKNDGRIKSHSL